MQPLPDGELLWGRAGWALPEPAVSTGPSQPGWTEDNKLDFLQSLDQKRNPPARLYEAQSTNGEALPIFRERVCPGGQGPEPLTREQERNRIPSRSGYKCQHFYLH